ncbi:PAS domain-containing protein [Methanoculleus sp.]|uniref:PAS domain-containing protein n=1 Tax=Methanoculleus sp. TaxID=90427 RepID=UPI002FC91AC4
MMSTTDAGKETITPPALAQGDGILIVNAEEKIVQANAPLQDLLSAAQEELLGADAADALRDHLSPLLPEERSGERVVALLRGGPSPPSITLGIRVPGSGLRRVSVTASMVEGITPVLRLLVFHDTGEGGGEPLRSTPGDPLPVIFTQDRDLRYTRAESPGENGRHPALVPGKTDADLFCQEDAARLTELKQRVLETGEGLQEDVRLVIDGTARTLDLTLVPARDGDGRVEGIMGVLLDAAGRQRAIEALAKSEQQLATLISNLRGMAYRCKVNRTWTMEFVSEGAERVTGYAPDDIVDDRQIAYGDIVHPDDREGVWREVTAGLAEKRPFQMTYRIITASGEERWVWEQGRGVPDPRRGAAVIEGYITDITDRVRAEAALAESEERFRSIFISSHAVMMIIDPETGAIVDANPAASAYYGYPLDTLTSMRISEINTLEPAEVLREMQRAVSGEGRPAAGQDPEEPGVGREQHFSFRHRLADGRVRDVDVFSGRVVICGRTLLHSIVHDITGQRRAEEHFRALLNATPDAALLLDRNGTILAVNEVMAERFGKSVGELLGMNVYTIFPPELAPIQREIVDQAMSTGKPLRHVDERAGMVLEGILFPIQGGSEEAARVAVISRDITRAQELERARRDAFSQIEQNIEQFAILGDHIRQPLQVILGMACLIEDERATKAIQNEVERINGYILQLDQGWIESRQVREFLLRHELV